MVYHLSLDQEVMMHDGLTFLGVSLNERAELFPGMFRVHPLLLKFAHVQQGNKHLGTSDLCSEDIMSRIPMTHPQDVSTELNRCSSSCFEDKPSRYQNWYRYTVLVPSFPLRLFARILQ
ncbi:hypothetical protein RRG08_033795 [Elysia crispata]|uniref:Uncharacterized protein n=1 Tax=Elysia crispata TaxID=231223 RepID=A0AAE1B8L5_9GAST|nr:hypothetical protein RRG08_033795 [Elysia crispata]